METAQVKCHRSEWQNEAKQLHEFEAWDQTKAAGRRRIGARVYTFEIDFTPASDDATGGYYAMTPGHYFGLVVSATRNGADYGASQPYRYFTTEAGREKAIAKYLKGARKRAEG